MKKIFIIAVIILLCILIGTDVIGCSGSTSPVTLPVKNQKPQAPSALSAEKVTQNEVLLRWTDRSDNENGFRIFRDDQLLATTEPDVSIYQDNGLNPATIYRYTVKAFNQAGESVSSTCVVKTLNPSIKIVLDKIGVYDNGESDFRDADGGEIYIYVVISDGGASQEIRIPSEEETYLKLKDNEIIDIGETIYSTDQVGDELGIAFVGYESDGGAFEQFVYQALGAAVEAQTAGSASGLLGAFNNGLEGLVGELFGAEDDWLGSYENSWGVDDKWGIGEYTEIVCEEENGTKGLRLWFIIESPSWSPKEEEKVTDVTGFNPQRVILEDQVSLSVLDRDAFSQQYPNGVINQFPINEYGFYCSELFSLEEGIIVTLKLESDAPLFLASNLSEYSDGVMVQVYRRIDSRSFSSSDAVLLSCKVIESEDIWETFIEFKANRAGSFQLAIVNYSGGVASCSFHILD